MSNSSICRIDRKALLDFYDTKPDGKADGGKDSRGHATAINAVAGEELGAELLKHYLENSTEAQVTILDESVTQGTQKGSRLDRWVLVKRADDDTTLFQVEIKNWSAHSFGGESFPQNASPEKVKEYKKKEWVKVWNEEKKELKWEGMAKVLKCMKPPPKYQQYKIEPLLCMWMAVHPDGKDEPFFSVELTEIIPCPEKSEVKEFTHLWVFSMSAYLRTLQCDYLDIEMPQTIQRMNWLKRLYG